MSTGPLRLVLYGDHELARSREEHTIISHAQANMQDLTTVDLSSITEDAFLEMMGTSSLFGNQRLLRIHNLEKIRSGKTISTYLTALTTCPDSVMIVIRGAMTPAKRKLFSTPWKLQEFKLPAVLFQFFESIKVRSLYESFALYRQALENDSEWSLHALAARQFRLLLAAKTGAPILAPPFAKGKLTSQAKKFTVAELVEVLHTLYDIERKIKSGRSALTWSQQFDILLARLYQEEKK